MHVVHRRLTVVMVHSFRILLLLSQVYRDYDVQRSNSFFLVPLAFSIVVLVQGRKTWHRENKCKLSMYAIRVKIVLRFYEKVSGWVTMWYGDSVRKGFTWQLDWDSRLDIISGSSSFREVLNILDLQVCFIKTNCHSIEVMLLNV